MACYPHKHFAGKRKDHLWTVGSVILFENCVLGNFSTWSMYQYKSCKAVGIRNTKSPISCAHTDRERYTRMDREYTPKTFVLRGYIKLITEYFCVFLLHEKSFISLSTFSLFEYPLFFFTRLESNILSKNETLTFRNFATKFSILDIRQWFCLH